MNDFFKTIYDHAQDIHAFQPELDPGFRTATRALDDLLETLHLDEETKTELGYAIDTQLYRSNVLSLTYGFRLAVQVIHPADPVYPARA